MAYDRKRAHTLLFGGLTWVKADNGLLPVALNDTWAWDGVFWTQISDMGPVYGDRYRLPRRFISMAYDIRRELVVLYSEGDTWIWDGKYWSQVADTGPVRRFEEHEIGLAYLPHKEKVYAHGNMGMGTWSWDGNEWLQVADTGTDRSLQALGCDERQNRLILLEGETGVTWECDGQIWKPVTSVGPGKETDLNLTCDATRVVAYAAQIDGNRPARRGTWIWENSHWKQVENMGPAPRIDSALAGDTVLGHIVLFGGSGSVSDGDMLFGDTWEYSPSPLPP
jgi:hypothetical protein